MLYTIYYGEISAVRKAKWNNGEDNPYDVLECNKKISCTNWISFLAAARKYLKDEIQIDWGSYAWKGTKDDILKLCKAINGEVQDSKNLKDCIEYGIIFIEES